MAEVRRRRPGRRKTVRRRRPKRRETSVYKRIIIGILIIGGLFLLNRLYLLWEIHGDMEATVKHEEERTEENRALKAEKDKLIDPEELINRARTQFGLVKQGEIPYKQ